MKIQAVPPEWVPLTWPYAEPYLRTALEHAAGDYTIEHLQALVACGQQLLVVATDDENTIRGAMTVQLFNRPADRVAFITATGGRGIISRSTLAQLKVLLAAQGATAIEAATRTSVLRLLSRLGFQQKYVTIGVKL